MSRLLVDEEFVAVQPSLVRALDGKVVDALVLQYLHFWLRVSTNEYEGEIWVYNTYQDWSDRLGISPKQAERAIKRLEEQDFILSCQPRAGAYDHKKWYRINYENVCLIDLPESGDQSGQIGRSTFSTERTNRETSTASSTPQYVIGNDDDNATDLTRARESSTTGVPGLSHPTPTTDSASESKPITKPKVDDDPDPEVVRLCNLLADLIEAHDVKRPNPDQKAWYRECRLLITKDGYTPEQVETIIRWAQADSFWCSNILSMPKLRDKFTQLRMKRNEGLAKKPSDQGRSILTKILEREAAK